MVNPVPSPQPVSPTSHIQLKSWALNRDGDDSKPMPREQVKRAITQIISEIEALKGNVIAPPQPTHAPNPPKWTDQLTKGQ
jgi:hypothetical protein